MSLGAVGTQVECHRCGGTGCHTCGGGHPNCHYECPGCDGSGLVAPCDIPGCPDCGGPAYVPALGPVLRYRVARDGAVGPAVYDRLADAVEVAVLHRGDGGRATIYRETDGGDLWVMARVDGRKERP